MALLNQRARLILSARRSCAKLPTLSGQRLDSAWLFDIWVRVIQWIMNVMDEGIIASDDGFVSERVGGDKEGVNKQPKRVC